MNFTKFAALFSMPPALQQDLISSAKNYYPLRDEDLVLGRRTAINNTQVDLWEGPTPTYNFPTVGQQLYVKSDSVNDTANGTGARAVHVHLLDANLGILAPVTVSMNGNSPVSIGPSNAYRNNGFHVASLGNLGVAAGNISLTDVTGNLVYGYIAAGENTGRQAFYTIPAGYYGYISGWRGSSGSSGNHVGITKLRSTSHRGILYPGVFLAVDEIMTQNSADSYVFPIPIKLPPGCDVKLSGISDAANAGVTMAGMAMGWVEPA